MRPIRNAIVILVTAALATACGSSITGPETSRSAPESSLQSQYGSAGG